MVFAVPSEVGTGSAEAPAVATAVAQPTPSRSPIRGLTWSRPRARPRPPLRRLALRRPDGEAALGPHLHPDSSAYSNSSWSAPPAVGHGFGPRGAPQPSARQANTPLRVPQPWPGPPTAADPAPAASSVPTVPIPSDRDRTEPVGTPLLRFTPPLGDTLPAPAKLVHVDYSYSRFSFVPVNISLPSLLAHFLIRCQYLTISCLLYTSPSPRDKRQSRMPSSA